jgi:hypothetical protein
MQCQSCCSSRTVLHDPSLYHGWSSWQCSPPGYARGWCSLPSESKVEHLAPRRQRPPGRVIPPLSNDPRSCQLTTVTGASSPSANSAVILLSRRAQSDAAAACRALGEQLWSPELKTASIQANLDYLKYQGKIGDSTLLWIGSSNNESRAIDATGKVTDVDAGLHLPVLCTQTAQFATASTQPNTNTQYQVSVHSNNEDYTGYVRAISAVIETPLTLYP